MARLPHVVVIDDFLDDPGAVRDLALRQDYQPSDYHKGKRSLERFLEVVDRSAFAWALGRTITKWEEHGMNGRFQICVAGDPIVYHSDFQSYAGVLFLTPDAPADCGLSLYRSRKTGLRRPPADAEIVRVMYENNLLDRTKWEEIDRIGNLFNRLVLWDGHLVHAPSGYFGTSVADGRLFQIFFFDAE